MVTVGGWVTVRRRTRARATTPAAITIRATTSTAIDDGPEARLSPNAMAPITMLTMGSATGMVGSDTSSATGLEGALGEKHPRYTEDRQQVGLPVKEKTQPALVEQMGTGLGQSRPGAIEDAGAARKQNDPETGPAVPAHEDEQQSGGGAGRQEQDPDRAADIVGARRRVGDDQEGRQPGADHAGSHPVRRQQLSTGHRRPDRKGEQKPADQQWLDQDQGAVAEGHELEDVAGDVTPKAEDPPRIPDEAGQQA